MKYLYYLACDTDQVTNEGIKKKPIVYGPKQPLELGKNSGSATPSLQGVRAPVVKLFFGIPRKYTRIS